MLHKRHFSRFSPCTRQMPCMLYTVQILPILTALHKQAISLRMLALRSFRVARPLSSVRFFSAGAPLCKDFVQDLYLKELKAYKPTASIDHAGAVKSYSTPSAPKAPAVPDAAALAKELDEYDAYQPPVDSPVATASSAHKEAGAAEVGADEFLKLCEADIKVEGKH